MNSRTVNLTLTAPVSTVYGFLSLIENLPLWATEFCERVWHDGSAWRIATSQGEMTGNFRPDATTGVIDQFIGPSAEQPGLFPIRVFALGSMTLVQFTFVQPPGLPDAIYEKQYASLLTEMRGIARRFGGGTLHALGFPAESMPSVKTPSFRPDSPMNIHPLTVTVSAPRDTVFNFLADIENLPKWTGIWCERLMLQRGRWWALTADGEQVVDMETSAGTGVIDFRAGPSPERFRHTPIRVVALSMRRTLVSFILIEGPDETDDAFARRRELLQAAADGLLKRFGGGEVHSAPPLAELGLN